MDLTGDEFVKAILHSIDGDDDELTVHKKEVKNGVVAAGCNYASEIVQLNIEYTKNGGTVRSQNFILKIFSSVPTYQMWESMGIYDREIEMYKTVLPAMAELLNQRENSFFPKLFQSIYPKVLVLEDLKSSGYVMMDRSKQLDFEHATVAMKTMAKFHALSVKLNEKSPEIFDKVKTDIYFNTEIGNKTFSDVYESGFDRLTAQFRKIEETSSYVDSFVKLKYQILHDVKEQLSSSPKRIQFLTHADYRLNNMMFKHDDDGNVIDIKLLDFQICRLCSPAIDIWYFLITSVPFPMFLLHFDSLIAIYYTSLEKMLQSLGCSIKYTFEEIKKEIENNISFGIYVLVAFLPGLIADTLHPVRMDEMVNDKGEMIVDFMEKTHEDKIVLKVVAKWFLYFNDKIKTSYTHFL